MYVIFFICGKVITFSDHNSTFKFFNFFDESPTAHPFPRPHTYLLLPLFPASSSHLPLCFKGLFCKSHKITPKSFNQNWVPTSLSHNLFLLFCKSILLIFFLSTLILWKERRKQKKDKLTHTEWQSNSKPQVFCCSGLLSSKHRKY